MMEYLGVEVPDVADGALQDTHWAGGSIGYFSTYALGNVASAQLWERISGHPGRVRADRPRRVRAAPRVAARACTSTDGSTCRRGCCSA